MIYFAIHTITTFTIFNPFFVLRFYFLKLIYNYVVCWSIYCLEYYIPNILCFRLININYMINNSIIVVINYKNWRSILFRDLHKNVFVYNLDSQISIILFFIGWTLETYCLYFVIFTLYCDMYTVTFWTPLFLLNILIQLCNHYSLHEIGFLMFIIYLGVL